MEEEQLRHGKKLNFVNSDSPKSTHESFYKNPSLSYVALIAKAILSSPVGKLNLASIYKYIEDNFPFYRNQRQGWRNSVRHNLSLNDCFIKVGRCEDGKGNYWSIHPANFNDFLHGDFRQHRRSRKRGRPKDLEVYCSVSYLPALGAVSCYMQPEALFKTQPCLMEPPWKVLYVSCTAYRQHLLNDYWKWLLPHNLMKRTFLPAIHSEEPVGNCFDWCHGSYLAATEQNIFLHVQQMVPYSILFPFRINRQDVY